jgi:DNA-binding NtrC family response regulator
MTFGKRFAGDSVPPTRILVVGDDEQHLRALIQSLSRIDVVVGGSQQLIQILRLLDQEGADLLLVDIDRLSLRDQGSLLAIRDSFPNLHIVGFSQQAPYNARRRALRFCLNKLVSPVSLEQVLALFPAWPGQPRETYQ